MEREYDHSALEERWMKEWVGKKYWRAPVLPEGEKRYTVTMYPYPSGDMHMGHVEIFTIHDAIARFARMQGFQVLNPIGFDSFGLPAENAAIQRGLDPKEWTYSNIDKLYSSAQRLGCSFDWDRKIATSDPEYYKWNQWFFLEFYERGLAYKKEAAANWCPNDKTVLANEQVVAGRCERCGAEVTKRYMAQWFFKITDYADRLLDDMELNKGWTERLKTLQSNWIGRSFGAEVEFAIGGAEPITVYTTRPDTLWGATFFVMAPEHPVAQELVKGTDKEKALENFKDEVAKLTEIDRTSTERPKKGMFLGRYAINPVNDERIPIWVADYVLMDYGTGAIMAVPAHDPRDLDFARTHDLPVRVVIQPPGGSLDDSLTEAYVGPGALVNSGPFDGTDVEVSVNKVTDWLESEGRGKHAKNFRLRDWLISRQRYWGTPIPIVFCDDCGEVPLPLTELPLELPDSSTVDFNSAEGESPLATATDWVVTPCPRCGKDARRETDTMDTFVDSSWYFHRYTDPHNNEVPFDPEKSNAWMPIDQYSGGIEHAVMHLIYARFFQKVLMEMGMAKDPEPFPHLLNQGVITMGGKKMSKSLGNLVEPQEAFSRFGADSLRLFMLFSGPPEANFDWPAEGVDAIGPVAYDWLKRVWRLCEENRDVVNVGDLHLGPVDEALRKHLHRTIKIVTEDYEAFSFNTAIARLHELVNQAYRYKSVGGGNPQLMRELIEALLKMLAPMTPYLSEEQWRRLGHDTSVHFAPWPGYDAALAAQEEVTMVVQVNGKVRDTLQVPADITEDRMKEIALASEKVRSHLPGEPSKVIVKPPKLISLVS